ncbi:EboA domain-containing protein [Azospirillum sp. ST 5-10]|uniref:EboA domain-containing protein n=1 Tax=unclassified Azospirillum TaxID=2630922 RepID=UPI003F4A45CA
MPTPASPSAAGPASYHPVDTQHALALLRRWLKAAAPPEGVDWLDGVRDAVNGGAPDGDFYAAFAAAPQRVGRAALRLSADERQEAERARAGWRPDRWTADVAARAMLLLGYDDSDPDAYGRMLTTLLKTGGVSEAVAVYRTLPLLPYPGAHLPWALEAVRSDEPALFDALAVHNPYPADHFDEGAWNRTVMRAVFLDVPLAAVEGLDRRANTVLAHELHEHVRQRRAAGRPVPPGLWQALGGRAAGALVDDLAALLENDEPAARMAAALALSRSPDARARAALDAHADLRDGVAAGRITWERVNEAPLRRAG